MVMTCETNTSIKRHAISGLLEYYGSIVNKWSCRRKAIVLQTKMYLTACADGKISGSCKTLNFRGIKPVWEIAVYLAV